MKRMTKTKQIIQKLLEAMDMQEKRETGEFHISQSNAIAIWEDAKYHANLFLEQEKDIIFYTTEAVDGTIRMALHPMHVAPRCNMGRSPRIKFKFRVVYTANDLDGWRCSCRGADFRGSNRLSGLVSDAVAMQWLIKGEKDGNA